MDALEFSKQYEANQQRLVQFVFKKCHSQEVAIDVAQSAWTRAWECREQFRGDSSFFTWVCNIAYHICVAEWRKGSDRLVQLPATLDVPYSPTTHDDYDAMLAWFESAVNQLNPNMRAVMRLRLKGILLEEIAKLLNMKENTCKINSKRAMDRLKAMAAGQ